MSIAILSKTIARDWDRAEEEKFSKLDLKSIRSKHLSFPELRSEIFPRRVAERLSNEHGMLGAHSLRSPSEVATHLLFFDTLAITGCSGCLTPDTLATASPLIERGLIVPILTFPYEPFDPKVLTFLERHQDEHVSGQAYSTYVNLALIPPHKEMTAKNHYCQQCLQEAASRINVAASSLSPSGRKAASRALRYLQVFSSPHMMTVARQIEERALRRDIRGMWQGVSFAHGICFLEQYRVLDSVPIMDVEEYRKVLSVTNKIFPELGAKMVHNHLVEFCANGLGVAYTPDLPLEEYLDIVLQHRGALRKVLPTTKDPYKAFQSATEIVAQFNDQISEIARARRYRWGKHLVNIGRTSSVLMRLALSALGAGDAGHAADEVVSSFVSLEGSSSKQAPLTDRILSRYFQKELPVIQTWRIRRRLDEAKRRSRHRLTE